MSGTWIGWEKKHQLHLGKARLIFSYPSPNGTFTIVTIVDTKSPEILLFLTSPVYEPNRHPLTGSARLFSCIVSWNFFT
jgi:hypothetical protein